MSRPSRPGAGRFDLIPPGAERRLAQLFERDAVEYGPRDWESGRPLSAFLNDARDALNLLHAGDLSADHAARAAWAMLCFMQVQAAVRTGRLPSTIDDMPAPDPILLPSVVMQRLTLGAMDVPVPPAPPVPPLLPGKP